MFCFVDGEINEKVLLLLNIVGPYHIFSCARVIKDHIYLENVLSIIHMTVVILAHIKIKGRTLYWFSTIFI